MRKKFLVVGLLAAILIVPMLVLGVLILATQKGRTPPPAITSLTAIDAHDGKIDLAWSPSDAEDFAYYAIYASEIEITDVTGLYPTSQINDRADVTYQITRYRVSGIMLALVDGTEYWFAVTAVDLAGNESKVGTSVSATPTKIEVTPPDLILTVFNIVIEAVHYPRTATVPLGTTVVWTNPNVGPHTVTSDKGLFHSRHIASGGTFSYTFTEVGVFYWRCRLDGGGVLAKVIVE